MNLIFPDTHSQLINDLLKSLLLKKKVSRTSYERARIILDANSFSNNYFIAIKHHISKKL